MENTVTANSTDAEIMDVFDSLRRQACGEAIGSADQTPEMAAVEEGWTIIRSICQGTNCPGIPVLVRDGRSDLWVVNDIEGPWAIQIASADPS